MQLTLLTIPFYASADPVYFILIPFYYSVNNIKKFKSYYSKSAFRDGQKYNYVCSCTCMQFIVFAFNYMHAHHETSFIIFQIYFAEKLEVGGISTF